MNLDIQQILTQIVAFLILLVILRRFAWRPILTLLDERRDRIAKGLKDIEESKARLEALKVDYEAKIRAIEDEARQKIASAVREGKEIASQIREESRQKAQELLKRMRENLEIEMIKAKVELKDEIARLVIETAEKVVGKTLSEDRHKELVMEFMKDLEKQ